MSIDFQQRLKLHEVVPPANCWEKIAVGLDEEFRVDETNLAARMTSISITPPENAWDKIMSGLDATAPMAPVVEMPSQGTPVVRSMPWKRLAAILVLSLMASVVYLYFNNDTPSELVSQETVNEAAPEPARPVDKPAVVQQQASIVPNLVKIPRSRRPVFRTNRRVNAASSPAADEYEVPETADIRYASIDNSEEAVENIPISVPTEPILDAQGNIIMDEKLISTPDNNYVEVTGPNGEQTKISKKFLRALSYMHSSPGQEEQFGILLQESSMWKWLFQEWRNELLNQASFIPCSTNFLDILEMKDILDENL